MKNRFLQVLAWLISFIVLIVVIGVAISFIIEYAVIGEDYLFYELSPFWSQSLSVIIAVPSLLISYLAAYKIREKLTSEKDDFWHLAGILSSVGKWNIAFLAVYACIVYVCITSVTYVTADKITVKTPFDLAGREYAYSEVERIEAGFGDKRRAFYEYEEKGNFYYKIILGGKETVFHMPTPNYDIERYDDTYLELEEFDAALSSLGIPKYASADGYENCKFDERYVERFLRIIGEEK